MVTTSCRVRRRDSVHPAIVARAAEFVTGPGGGLEEIGVARRDPGRCSSRDRVDKGEVDPVALRVWFSIDSGHDVPNRRVEVAGPTSNEVGLRWTEPLAETDDSESSWPECWIFHDFWVAHDNNISACCNSRGRHVIQKRRVRRDQETALEDPRGGQLVDLETHCRVRRTARAQAVLDNTCEPKVITPKGEGHEVKPAHRCVPLLRMRGTEETSTMTGEELVGYSTGTSHEVRAPLAEVPALLG